MSRLCAFEHSQPVEGWARCSRFSHKEGATMTLTIFDPLTGKRVTITVPDGSSPQPRSGHRG